MAVHAAGQSYCYVDGRRGHDQAAATLAAARPASMNNQAAPAISSALFSCSSTVLCFLQKTKKSWKWRYATDAMCHFGGQWN